MKPIDITTLLGVGSTIAQREAYIRDNYPPGSVRLGDDRDRGIFHLAPNEGPMSLPFTGPGRDPLRGPMRWILPSNTPEGHALWQKQYAEMAAGQVHVEVTADGKSITPATGAPATAEADPEKKAKNIARTASARAAALAKRKAMRIERV